MDRKSGITLAELMVAVSIASLLLGATASLVVPTRPRPPLDAAGLRVQSYAQLARLEAILRERPCSLTLDTMTGELRVTDSLGTGSPADDILLYEGRLPETVSLEPLAESRAQTSSALPPVRSMVFGAQGALDSGSGAIGISAGEDRLRVVVQATGRIVVERPAPSS